MRVQPMASCRPGTDCQEQSIQSPRHLHQSPAAWYEASSPAVCSIWSHPLYCTKHQPNTPAIMNWSQASAKRLKLLALRRSCVKCDFRQRLLCSHPTAAVRVLPVCLYELPNTKTKKRCRKIKTGGKGNPRANFQFETSKIRVKIT